MRILVLLLAFLALLCGPAPAATTLSDSQKEYIILTGGVSMWQWEKYKAAPHDNWWMNFVRASRIRIQQIQAENPNELINYLNYGQNRDQVKIVNFEFFGHSNRACWMFDYSANVDSASKCWLHEDELKQIRRGIFTKDAFVKSWSCHTGEEMSKKWKSATGIPMIGAIGKTQYMTDELPVLSSANGKWVK
jgi:hypothetical protein